MHCSRLRCLQLQLLKSWSSRIGIGGGVRTLTQTNVNCNEEERKNFNVWQNWVISILKEAAEKEKAEKIKAANQEVFIKRPSKEAIKKYQSTGMDIQARIQKGIQVRRSKMQRKESFDRKLIWVDCEMTGLDPMKDQLLEIAMIVTDSDLNVIAKQEPIVFHVEDSVLAGMGEWCQKHHGDSGLIEASRKSTMTHEAADEILLKFVQDHTAPFECPMAGNSVGGDKIFIANQLPKLHSHFHYRIVDVSTVKELVSRWYPKASSGAPKKKFTHRALDDIMESIEELKYYRAAAFKPQESSTDDSQKKTPGAN